MGMYSAWITRGLESRYRRPALTASRGTKLNPLSELFTILLVIVVLVGAISREPMIAAPGALAFVIAMVARIWSALSLEEITIDRSSSVDHAFQSDEIEITFTIENNKPLPVPWLEINEYVPRGLLVEGQKAVEQSYLGGAEIKVSTALRPYERVRVKRKLTALSRGKYRLGKTRLRSGDLFGLYPSDASLDHTAWSIYVYPRIKPLLGFSLMPQRPIGDSIARHQLWDDPSRPSGVREYRPGDPIKNIDWKTTARRNDIFVRQFDPSVSEQIVIFAEAITTNVPWEGYRSDVLEGTMNAAASISSHALELGYKVGLVTNGVSSSASHAVVTPGTGQAQLTVLLESLAMVHPIAVRTLDEMAKNRMGAIPPGSTLIHVGGIYHPRTVNYLLQLKKLGHHVMILHIGREEPPKFPGLEIRDGRGLFLLASEDSKDDDFRRPFASSSNWNESEMSVSVNANLKRGSQ